MFSKKKNMIVKSTKKIRQFITFDIGFSINLNGRTVITN